MLATTILLMAGATFLRRAAARLRHASGILAPIGLIILRMIQGFSTGGEYGGAATFMAEYAPDRRRGFLGSFLEFGTLAGFTLGAVLVLVVQLAVGPDAMHAWGWRLPFLVAAPLGLIGDLPAHQARGHAVLPRAGGVGRDRARDLDPVPRPAELLAAAPAARRASSSRSTSRTTRCSPTCPPTCRPRSGSATNAALVLIIIGQLVMMVLLPFSGALSDRFGRKPLWWVSLVGLFVLAIPMYKLMATGFAQAILAFIVLGLLYIPQLSTISATFPAMFPTHVRYAGFAIAYNVSTSLFGGTAPAVNDRP